MADVAAEQQEESDVSESFKETETLDEDGVAVEGQRDQVVEGEGDQAVEEEGDQAVEEEGDQAVEGDGDQVVEGDGDQVVEGEGDQIDEVKVDTIEEERDLVGEEEERVEESGDSMEGVRGPDEDEQDQSEDVSEAPASVTVFNVEEVNLETGEIQEEHMAAFEMGSEEAAVKSGEEDSEEVKEDFEGEKLDEDGEESKVMQAGVDEGEETREGGEVDTERETGGSEEAQLKAGLDSGEVTELGDDLEEGRGVGNASQEGEDDEEDDKFEDHPVVDKSAETAQGSYELSVLHEEAEVEYDEQSLGLVQPQEFKLRALADDFTLDPEFNENELMSLLDVRSEYSVDSVAYSAGAPTTAPYVRPSRAGMLTTAERDKLCEQYHFLSGERTHLVRTNSVLQKRLLEHFKRRHMTDMFKEPTEVSPDLQLRYDRQLAGFAEAQNADSSVRCLANEQLTALNAETDRQSTALQLSLDELVDAEREAGVGLVDSKSGKILSERQVYQLLEKQCDRVRQLVDHRVSYFKLRDSVDAKEAATRDLEDLGDGTKMADYEQLRVEQQNRSDKLEERDEEVVRLRQRTGHLITSLSHLREKSSTYVGLIDQKSELLKSKEEKLDLVRSELTKQKTQRDGLRSDFLHETAQAGLLTNPLLLRDFEEALDERDRLRGQLTDMRSNAALELRELNQLRESCAAAGDGNMPSRSMTYKEVVDQRVAVQRGAREAIKLKGQVSLHEHDEMFQML